MSHSDAGDKAPEVVQYQRSAMDTNSTPYNTYNKYAPLQPTSDHHYEHTGASPVLAQPSSSKRSRLISSPGEFTSGILFGAIIATVIIGAALGGGLGAKLATCQAEVRTFASAPSPTTSTYSIVTTTVSNPSATASTLVLLEDYVAPDPSTVDTLHNNCTSTTQSTLRGDKFTTACGRDFNNNVPAAEGGVIADIVGLVAYSFEDCLNACSNLKFYASKWNLATTCRSITFATNMRDALTANDANCWLKNGSVTNPSSAYANSNAQSATLVT